MANQKSAREQSQGVTSTALAQLWDCTPRHVELLAVKGIAVRVGRGQYALAQSTKNYIKHLREQAAARVGSDPTKDSVGANVKHKDAQTRLTELRIAKEAGELVARSDVKETWTRVMKSLRQFVLGLPGKIAFDEPTLTPSAKARIERICREGLEDMALARGFTITGTGPPAGDAVLSK